MWCELYDSFHLYMCHTKPLPFWHINFNRAWNARATVFISEIATAVCVIRIQRKIVINQLDTICCSVCRSWSWLNGFFGYIFFVDTTSQNLSRAHYFNGNYIDDTKSAGVFEWDHSLNEYQLEGEQKKAPKHTYTTALVESKNKNHFLKTIRFEQRLTQNWTSVSISIFHVLRFACILRFMYAYACVSVFNIPSAHSFIFGARDYGG